MSFGNRAGETPLKTGDFFRRLGKVSAMVLLALLGAWCAGAVYFVWHFSAALSVLFAISLLLMLLSARFIPRAGWMLFVTELCVLISFLLLTPQRRFDGEKWNVECRKVPQIIRMEDGKIRIADVRDFRYRTPEDFDVNYREMMVDPAKLESMDVIFSYWMSIDAVAHMLLGFNFSDGTQLAVSFEPQVPYGLKGGSFWWGVYRQYGQMMLFATPEDVVDLRIKYRKEKVYRFRSAVTGEVLKNIFMETVKIAEKLNADPAFYHSVTTNCTTGLLPVFRHFPDLGNADIRCLLNGYYDRFLFERGFFARMNGENFTSFKARHLCN